MARVVTTSKASFACATAIVNDHNCTLPLHWDWQRTGSSKSTWCRTGGSKWDLLSHFKNRKWLSLNCLDCTSRTTIN
jgi:hypothetical protein